jgi:hypothetical protein
MAGSNLTAERLREVLSYDPESGEFRWKRVYRGISRSRPAGSPGKRRGEVTIRVDGDTFLAHRLAFLYVTGAWPLNDVDHIDGDPSNNKWSNLRDVPHQTNQQNIRAAHKSNRSSGLLGVSLHVASGLWRARITVSGKEQCLGYFHDKDLAHKAYISAKRVLHKGCTI